MTRLRNSGSALALAFAMVGLAVPALAQDARPLPPGPVTIAQPTPDADALAAQMRVLAQDPKNVDALIGAGDLTLKLGDPTAAAVLYSRAEKVAPANPRLKAGMGAVLVHLERPGEALRMFDQAAKAGYPVGKFAAARGLAYDLIGEQDRAQRDYRLALEDGTDEEVTRRYALSLGIAGKRDQALALLDPLIRGNDRAAWRDRAFVLAMNGDAPGAEYIATTMMPGAIANGLKPFFERLAGLSPVDRAFAVHFGEVRPTPARLADAKLAPPMSALPPEAALATRLAQSEAAPVPGRKPAKARTRTARRKAARVKPGRVAIAATSTPTPTPAPAPIETARTTPPAPVKVAAADTKAAAPTPTQRPTPGFTTLARAAAAAAPRSVPPAKAAMSAGPAEKVLAATADPSRQAPATSALAVPRAAVSAGAPPASRAAPQPTPPAHDVGAEDEILARIVAGISVPAAELGVGPVARAAPAPAASTSPAVGGTTVDEAAVKRAADAAAAKKAADAKAAREKAAAEKAAAEKVAAEKEAAAEKAAAEKKTAAEKKAAAAKAAAAKAEKAAPQRYWVQVAGGANEATLLRAWRRVRDKAPDLFKGHDGWTTPLNATNRVLTGPFASADAAQDFVNKLAGKDVAAFPFTSEKGQKIERLPAK